MGFILEIRLKMKVKITKKPKKLRFVIGIKPCGNTFEFTEAGKVTAHFKVPVIWRNRPASFNSTVMDPRCAKPHRH